jgi:predicted nucleic acid-binding protein
VALVVDASTALTWCFEDEAQFNDPRMLSRVLDDGIVVPAIWPLEVSNAITLSHRGSRIDDADLERFVRLLTRLTIEIDIPAVERIFSDVIELARSFQLTTYDASYIELARRLGIQLVTSDRRMIDAATGAGVAIFTPQ